MNLREDILDMTEENKSGNKVLSAFVNGINVNIEIIKESLNLMSKNVMDGRVYKEQLKIAQETSGRIVKQLEKMKSLKELG